jgi:hypothetical protein
MAFKLVSDIFKELKNFMKLGIPAPRATRLFDQVPERIRHLHYSLSTEKIYLHWSEFFIRWQTEFGAPLPHPLRYVPA